MDTWNMLLLVHLFGLALAVGAATVKFVLVMGCWRDAGLLPAFTRVRRPVTRLIVLGLIMLALSGLGWLLLGAATLTPLLGVKIALVITVFVVGPYIDRVIEPQLERLMPPPGEEASPAFSRIQRLHVALEGLATGLLYFITVAGVLI